MLATESDDKKRSYILIGALSILIPLSIALLFFMPSNLQEKSGWISALPHLNGFLNSTTAIVLVLGFVFIKKKQVTYHKTAMIFAFILGTLFLISYVTYHAAAPSTVFGDVNGDGLLSATEEAEAGVSRTVYLIILLSHILLSVVVVPFVLLAFYYALTKRFEKHRKIVQFTLPIWLYVSISGVLVYWMISPYYQ